jgi:HprK-related kinase A
LNSVLDDLSERDFRNQLRTDGLPLQIGCLDVRVHCRGLNIEGITRSLYGSYPLANASGPFDFHVKIVSPLHRRLSRPQAVFYWDGGKPFEPLPAALGFPALEWGINWCIANRAHRYLMLHSACVEKNGDAVLFPAWPGHGKTTLCAALINRGWRLLSDEFGLVRPEDDLLQPVPRPLPLKNESIEVIRRFAPDAFMGPTFPKTRKGNVAHMRPPADSIARAQEPAVPRWLVFPRWVADSQTQLEPMPGPEAFFMVATNAFNYEVRGEAGFRTVSKLVRSCQAYRLVYSNLEEAVDAINGLLD